MTGAEIVALITGFFKFFDQVKWFILTLQKTPSEKREGLMKALRKEEDSYAQGGRPVWKD